MNRDEFLTELVNTFPEIKDDVLDEDNDGLITLQIGYFRKLIQTAIDNNNFEEIKRSFEFVDRNIGEVDSKVENSLYLSFLNKLDFTNNKRAEKLLSKKLFNAKNELDEYDKKSNDELNDFLNELN